MQLEPDTTDIEPTDLEGEAPLPEEGANSNRTFLLIAIPLVLVFLCIAGGLGFYALVLGPQQRHAKETQVAGIVLTNTQIALQNENAQKPPTLTATPKATLTPLPTETALPAPTDTPLPTATKAAESGSVASPTPLLALPSNTPAAASPTPAPSNTAAAVTPTISVSQTKAPAVTSGPSATPGKGTATATPLVGGLKTATPTQLPGTGFADEAGVPMLIIVGLALVAVTVVVRRLRLSLR